jgi:hypothetical protein
VSGIVAVPASEHEEQRRIELGGVIVEQVHDLPEAVAGDDVVRRQLVAEQRIADRR